MQKAVLDEKNIRIAELSDQHSQTQEKYHEAMTTIAVLKERLNKTTKQSLKFKTQKQLKPG